MLRKRYFIHPSVQLKYIAMSILPALALGIFTAYIISVNAETAINLQHDRLKSKTAISSTLIEQILKEKPSAELATNLLELEKNNSSIQEAVRDYQADVLNRWDKTKNLLFVVFISVLISVSVLAVLYSHRIVGPIYRIRKSLDEFYEGKDIPSGVRLRNYDEFKELAASVEKLRNKLVEKKFLK